jgi:hypothetical protein
MTAQRGQASGNKPVRKTLCTDFHFADLHIARSLDGLMAEMQ